MHRSNPAANCIGPSSDYGDGIDRLCIRLSSCGLWSAGFKVTRASSVSGATSNSYFPGSCVAGAICLDISKNSVKWKGTKIFSFHSVERGSRAEPRTRTVSHATVPPLALCFCQFQSVSVAAQRITERQSASSVPSHSSNSSHATAVLRTPPAAAAARRRRLDAARPRGLEVDAGVLRLVHSLPVAPLLHALRRPQAGRAGGALLRGPAGHPGRQRHGLRRPGPRGPHPPRGAPTARAGPVRLLRRHPQGHLRALRVPPRRHARLHRRLRLRRAHHRRLDPGLQRHPRRRHRRRRRRRRDQALRAAALRVLRRRRRRRASGVPHLRRGRGRHRAGHRAQVPHHRQRPDERQRHGHRRRRRRGHRCRPAARLRLVVPFLHVGRRPDRRERDLRHHRQPLRAVQLRPGQPGPILRAGAAGGLDVLQHAVQQQQHDARQLHPRHDQRRVQRHLLQLRRIRERHNPHHVDHVAEAKVPRPTRVPPANAAADVVLLRDVPRPVADADAVRRRRWAADGRHGAGGQYSTGEFRISDPSARRR